MDHDASDSGSPETTRANRFWAWHPPLPLQRIPVFMWPPNFSAMVRYLLGGTFLGGIIVPFVITAAIVWFWTTPPITRFITVDGSLVIQLWIRNVGLMTLFAGGLHLFFYVARLQGDDRRFDTRDIRINRRFLAGRQLIDNMFWTLASGVTVWTLYETFLFWGIANGYFPGFMNWHEHPVLFVAMFVLIPFFTSMHFYFVHRLLHWPPLYRVAHALHHRNDNLGPWSGLSMHPVEHLIYLSSILVHTVVLSHPLHILFHLHWNTLGAASSHAGFEAIRIRGRNVFALGSFHHQLHHRFFNCNYGNPFMPWDRWLNTDNDGTDESIARMRARTSTSS